MKEGCIPPAFLIWVRSPYRYPLNRDSQTRLPPSGHRPPGQRHPRREALWTETPRKNMGPGQRPPKEHGNRQPDRKWHNTESPPPCKQNDWRMLLKTLPYPKLRLRAVKTKVAKYPPLDNHINDRIQAIISRMLMIHVWPYCLKYSIAKIFNTCKASECQSPFRSVIFGQKCLSWKTHMTLLWIKLEECTDRFRTWWCRLFGSSYSLDFRNQIALSSTLFHWYV